MTVARVALVTCAALREGSEDDRLLLEPLRTLGVAAEFVVWDAPSVPWSTFDAVVLRSPWDYHLKPNAFRQWVRERAAEGAALWNSPDVVLWNHHKGYLRTLSERGVRVVPTEWIPRGSDVDPREVLDRRGWSRAVVKPAVSASAHRTEVLPDDPARAARLLRALARRSDLLMQPFIDQVVAEGEWSLVFVGGRYSHAVLKRAAAGEFRVQERFGGAVTPAVGPLALIDDAGAVLDTLGADLLYARVDGVRDGDRLRLMELEVIEPSLFLACDHGAAERFAEAVACRVRARAGAPS